MGSGMRRFRWLCGGLMCGALCVVTAARMGAAEPSKPAAKDPKPAKTQKLDLDSGEPDAPKDEPGKKDPLAIPEKASPEELLKFVKGLFDPPPRVRSQEELIERCRKLSKVGLTAVDKALAQKPDEDLLMDAITLKFDLLDLQEKLGVEGAETATAKFAASMLKSDNPKLVALAKSRLLQADVEKVPEMDEAERKAFVDRLLGGLAGDDDDVDRNVLSAVEKTVRQLEATGDDKLAIVLCEKTAARLEKNKDPRLVLFGTGLASTARRLQLVGNTIDIEGDAINGKPFDWNAYRGKVVLVDYWATWCGPCIMELPNVIRAYKHYHDAGFDVVGISLDDNEDKVKAFLKSKKIPWTTLFSSDETAQGWEHPMATKHGITAIPQAILVGRDGKVLTLNARGEELFRWLKKVFPNVPEPTDDEPSPGPTAKKNGKAPSSK